MDYRIGKLLNEGSYSKVYNATKNGKEYVVKKMKYKKKCLTYTQVREFEILANVQHDRIIHVYD